MTEEWDEKKQRESLAKWMIEHGFTTGHGDTIEDLFRELGWQIKELRDQLWSYRKEKAES
jgi:O-methyltransferase involved in polyketide biosynthesis